MDTQIAGVRRHLLHDANFVGIANCGADSYRTFFLPRTDPNPGDTILGGTPGRDFLAIFRQNAELDLLRLQDEVVEVVEHKGNRADAVRASDRNS